MRRFGRAFLTTAAVLILLVNLVVILLYGRQFYACPSSSGCDLKSVGSLSVTLPVLNIILASTFLLVWLAVMTYRRRHP